MHGFFLSPGNLDLVSFTGPDAMKLLQGQLTCDVDAVPEPGFCRGALCNNKGRVLATFILVRHAAAFHLVLSAGLGEILAQALKKYLPFYKCELQLAAAAQQCTGVCKDASLAAHSVELPAAGQCLALGDGWICNLDQGQQQYLVYSRTALPLAPESRPGTLDDWLACGMHSGQFPFLASDTEKFTPQELHLDRNGYVSFTKGCYTGQEIVARMHYRGKLKKLLFLLETPAAGPGGDEAPEVLDSNGTPLDSTLRVLRSGDTLYALVVLPAEAANSPPPKLKTRSGQDWRVRVF